MATGRCSPTVGDAGTRFVRSGLVVRSDAAVELRLGQPSSGQARIGWGTAEPSTVVRVPPCPAPRPRWLAFAGGYWSNGPACVGMTVLSGTTTKQVTIGIDRGC